MDTVKVDFQEEGENAATTRSHAFSSDPALIGVGAAAVLRWACAITVR